MKIFLIFEIYVRREEQVEWRDWILRIKNGSTRFTTKWVSSYYEFFLLSKVSYPGP